MGIPGTTAQETVEAADTVGSPFEETAIAFEARWDLIAPRDDIEVWGPAGSGGVSIGLALRGAAEESVVDVALDGRRVRLSDALTDAPLDLAAVSRVLQLPAFEVRRVLQAAVEALHYAREAYRLVDELEHALAAVRFRERELDRSARAGGHGAAWLKDAQAQYERVVDLEARRDRFAVRHGLGGVTASDLEDHYGLAQDVRLLTQEREDLADAGLMGWLQAADPPFSPVRGLLRPVTTLWQLAHGIATYLRYTRLISRDLAVAQERRQIAGELYVAYEALADAQELQAALAEVTRLREQVAANLRAASTPVHKPTVPTPYGTQPTLGPARSLEPPAEPHQPGSPGRRPGRGAPGL